MNGEIFNTDRMQLRRLNNIDYQFIFDNYTELNIKKELGIENHEIYLKEIEKHQKKSNSYGLPFQLFQLIDNNTKDIIGGCGFHNYHPEHQRAEIGYHITKEALKRKGLMTEAMKSILDYGFNVMKLNRVEACVSPDNMASIKLLEKFHFTREGLLRQHYCKDNIIYDSLIFSLLKEEYFSNTELI